MEGGLTKSCQGVQSDLNETLIDDHIHLYMYILMI